MIGDWVSYNGHPVLVEALNKSDGYAIEKDMISIKLNDNTCLGINVERLEPLPLTDEILSKNNYSNRGFEEDKHHLLEISDWRGKIWWSIAMGEYNIMELQYVHQLQHALKLCGIEKDIVL